MSHPSPPQANTVQANYVAKPWVTAGDPHLFPRREIGSGGSAEVHEIYDEVKKTVFARKIVKIFGDVTVEDTNREAKAILLLYKGGGHQNLITVTSYGYKVEYGFFYIDMELCNFSLHDYIYLKLSTPESVNLWSIPECPFQDTERGPWNIWDIMEQISGGLEFIHDRNVVHRDLKPNNVLYAKSSGRWKITDFGISTNVTSDKPADTRNIKGSSGYIPPELLKERHEYSKKSDIWAMGCLLFELAFGKKAFISDSEAREFEYDEPPSFKSLPERGDKSILPIIHSLLEVNPTKRPSADALHKISATNLWQSIGDKWKQRGRLEAAIKAYKKGTEANSSCSALWKGIVDIYEARERAVQQKLAIMDRLRMEHEAELYRLQEKIAKLEIETKAHRVTIENLAALKEENRALQLRVADVDIKISKFQKERENLENEKNLLEDRLGWQITQKTQSNEKLKHENEKLRQENDQLQSRTVDLDNCEQKFQAQNKDFPSSKSVAPARCDFPRLLSKFTVSRSRTTQETSPFVAIDYSHDGTELFYGTDLNRLSEFSSTFWVGRGESESGVGALLQALEEWTKAFIGAARPSETTISTHQISPTVRRLNQSDSEQTLMESLFNYLSNLRTYIQDMLLTRDYQGTGPSYFIAVPAIWTEQVRNHFSTALRKVPANKKLVLIPKPEAAIFFAVARRMIELQDEDCIIVCDISGLVEISAFRILFDHILQIEECTEPNVMESSFQGFLKIEIGRLIRHKFAELSNEDMNCLIEEVLKGYHFLNNVHPDDTEEMFDIPHSRVVQSPDQQLIDGHPRLSREEISSIFDAVSKKIVDLLKGQIQAAAPLQPVRNKILLIGHENYLKDYITTTFGSAVPVQYIEAHDTAEGIMHYLDAYFGVGRQYVLRRHYGIQVAVPFIRGSHSEIFKFEAHDGTYASAVMQWPAKKGDKISKGHTVSLPVSLSLEESEMEKSQVNYIFYLKSWDGDRPPEYFMEEFTDVCSLIIDLKTVPVGLLEKKTSTHGRYLELVGQISIVFREHILELKYAIQSRQIGTSFASYI